MASFRLVAVDFEANAYGRVRQAGVALLDSEDLVVDGKVLAVEEWVEYIRVRRFVIKGLKGTTFHHPNCAPGSDPLYR